MATIPFTREQLKTVGDDCHIFSWAALTTTNNYGDPVAMPGSADRSVQLVGTLGAGGAVTIYGSNVASPDPTDEDDWAVLTDPQGNNLVLTALKIEAVTEVVRWIRPKITAGDGSTSLTVHILLRRP